MSGTPTAFYTREGQLYVPTGLGISPWNPRAQMGVALAGLVAHALDAESTLVPMMTARLTIDIMGAVPLEPLVSRLSVLRQGKRLQLLSLDMLHLDTCWVRATALRVRLGEGPLVEQPISRSFPDASAIHAAMNKSGFAATIPVEGGFPEPGPGAWWVRPLATVVEGEALRPLEAIAMIADYGSGVAPLASPDEWTFANVDIALHLTRMPRGEWLLIDSNSQSSGNGIGLAQAHLGDRDGMFGAAHQTIFLDRR